MTMNRREFGKGFALGAMALRIHDITTFPPPSAPQIALTMDDFAWRNAIKLSAQERNEAILGTLDKTQIRAALFVIGRNVEDQEGRELLKGWNDAGHLIGNHTYSHRNYHDPALTTSFYEEDILRAESLLSPFSQFKKYFRFPMLKEGNTVQKRDALRSFLKRQGYRAGYVTIDNSDWIVDQRLRARLQKEPNADLSPYRDFYLQHMWERAEYYESLARSVLRRPVKHTLLTHFNLLNGLFLNDLVKKFKSKGWRWINAEEAFLDPVFTLRPRIVPAGESIIWGLAKESGRIRERLRYPAEDGEYEMAKMDKLGL
jgi:peptidoglycan-N-acetylglucosamine deacetylase